MDTRQAHGTAAYQFRDRVLVLRVMKPTSLTIALAMTVAAALLAPAAQAAPVSLCNVAIQMSDGVVLRANVFLPDDKSRVPVVLTTTGYNKDVGNPTGTACDG
ncbi:MAG: hypothetical protein ACJ77Z_02085, partial [Thermoleophilaceae bacterium]